VAVAGAIGAIILMVVMLVFMVSGKSLAAIGNYVDLDNKSRKAMDLMLKEIRQARALTAYTSNSLTLLGFTNQQLTFTWDPDTSQLTRSVNGASDSSPLLTGCDQLNFRVYQRSPSNSFGLFDTASDVSLCKLVEVSWVCSRNILGSKANTESVQTAKIVIRNQKVQN
jgi:Tfp pilus assembly protein PilW